MNELFFMLLLHQSKMFVRMIAFKKIGISYIVTIVTEGLV
jgi:hypothetical protein